MLDLRREGVDMAMWGILISSDNPGQLAEAMRAINKEINKKRSPCQEKSSRVLTVFNSENVRINSI